jgi:hypothetical protein
MHIRAGLHSPQTSPTLKFSKKPRCARWQVSAAMPPKSAVSEPAAISSTAWRTGNRQPIADLNYGTWRLKVRYAPYKRAKGDKLVWASSTDAGYEQTWATREAAEAAKADFKLWVDEGRNPLKRAAQAESTVARAQAAEAARARPMIPTRFRGGVRLKAAKVTVALRVGTAGAVTVALACEPHASEGALLQWHKRASQVVDRRKRRLDAAEAAAAEVPEGIWADFFERCRKAQKRASNEPSSSAATAPSSSGARQKPRGKSRALRIGQRRHHHDHKKRRDHRWALEKERVAAAHAVRIQRIERLRKALLSGNVISLLRPDEAGSTAQGGGAEGGSKEGGGVNAAKAPPPAPISTSQASRLTTQGWAVVRFYEELDAIELGVLDGSRTVPKGGAKNAAAAAGGAFVGANADTDRAWAYDFEPAFGSSSCGFSRDQRGSWERELLVHEEQLRKPFHKWMVERAREYKLSVEAAHEYLNSTLLRPPHVTVRLYGSTPP